ncbi:alpha-tocopherol transfer protein-like [Aricia agestis]|uniref:alpha-tocopherol transfer protein-like n=1 Tax=Aricia agestis TaxID=91739 RepID=UPI001C20A387|nr:alpha-tocopherol transfer protein-like [Aricia agestis]
MTPDHCRVHLFQARTTKMDATKVSQYMKLFLIVSDYVQLYDYNNGLMYLADWRGGSAIDFTMSVNFTQFRTILDTAFEGYSMRIKAIHILTDSKPMTALVMLFKQVMSAKISSRIQVHNTLDSVYEYIPKSVLPVEYGGEDRTVRELRDEFIEELCSDYFKDYRKQINKARTDENFRSKDLFNSEYMGMSGTFRNLSVD